MNLPNSNYLVGLMFGAANNEIGIWYIEGGLSQAGSLNSSDFYPGSDLYSIMIGNMTSTLSFYNVLTQDMY